MVLRNNALEKIGENTGNSTIKSAELVFDKEKKGWKLDVV